MECPEDLICFTEEEWIDFLTEYELDIANEVGTLPTLAFYLKHQLICCFCISNLWFVEHVN